VSYLATVSVLVFGLTLFLMIKRPKGINLGLAAGIGAVLSLVLGTVSIYDAIQSFIDIWDAALAFVGIVALSVALDAMGFFKWAALKVVKFSRCSGIRLLRLHNTSHGGSQHSFFQRQRGPNPNPNRFGSD